MGDSGKPVFEVDGSQVRTVGQFAALFDPFLQEVGLNPVPEEGDFGPRWEGGLDHLIEILSGWFVEEQIGSSWDPPGSPQGFILRWKDSSISREAFGARDFDRLVAIFKDYGPGGRWPIDGVELVLE